MGFEQDSKRGVLNHYGTRSTNLKYGAQMSSGDVIRKAIWDFSYNDLPDAATNSMGFVIPANATIVSAKLIVDAAFTSTSTTTDLTVGLQKADGTEIDDDGLISAAEATQTAIGTAGNVVTGAGALVGKVIGSNDGELVVTPTANDLLTGAGRVIVEYVYNS